MKQSEDQINNRNARSDLMTTEVTTVQQQINQNVQNDHRTGEMSAKTEEEQKKQHAVQQKESRKKKVSRIDRTRMRRTKKKRR